MRREVNKAYPEQRRRHRRNNKEKMRRPVKQRKLKWINEEAEERKARK